MTETPISCRRTKPCNISWRRPRPPSTRFAMAASMPRRRHRDEASIYTLAAASTPIACWWRPCSKGPSTAGTDGSILYCNRSFAEMAGRPHEAIVGSSSSFISLLQQKRSAENLARLSGRRTSREPVQRPEGIRWPFTWYQHSFPGGRATVISFYRSDPAKAVSDLQAADRRKDEFLAMLGHEFGTRSAPIANAVQMLCLTRMENREVVWACDVVDRQVRQMTRIVDDLLDVSRITRGADRAADATSRRRRHRHAGRGNRAGPRSKLAEHRLQVSLAPAAATRRGRRNAASQALTNLLNNAANIPNPGERSGWRPSAKRSDV